MGVPIRRRLRSGRRRDLTALVITSLVRAASVHPVIPGLAPSRSFPASLLPSRRMPGSRAGFSSFGVSSSTPLRPASPHGHLGECRDLAVVFGAFTVPTRRGVRLTPRPVVPANARISRPTTFPSSRRMSGSLRRRPFRHPGEYGVCGWGGFRHPGEYWVCGHRPFGRLGGCRDLCGW